MLGVLYLLWEFGFLKLPLPHANRRLPACELIKRLTAENAVIAKLVEKNAHNLLDDETLLDCAQCYARQFGTTEPSAALEATEKYRRVVQGFQDQNQKFLGLRNLEECERAIVGFNLKPTISLFQPLPGDSWNR